MRFVAAIVICYAASARAETESELEAKGEQLAQDGRYTDAIATFKAADKLAPRAKHMCLIGLAYTRRELWPQAEIFMARCHVLGATEALPDWVPQADKLIKERIAAATVAEVSIQIDPSAAQAELSVSSFLPDETFSPSTRIHLAPGHHVITATASGYETEHVALDIAGTSPRPMVIRMYRTGTRPKPSALPRAMMIGGAVTLGAGAVAYAVMGVGWWKLQSRDDNNFGGSYQKLYEVARPVSLSLFAVGAGLAIIGWVVKPAREAPVQAALAPLPGGGMFAVQWTR